MNIKTLSITVPLFIMISIVRAGDAPGSGVQVNETSDAIAVSQSGTNAMQESFPAIFGSEGVIVFKLAGDGQKVMAGQWTPASLEVGVWKENGPKPLINVPVDFSLADGVGWLAGTPDGDAGRSVQILTDIDGIAQVWHRQPDQANVQSTITASALGKSVIFTVYSIAPADGVPAPANTNQPNAITPANTLPHPTPELAAPTPANLSQKSLLLSLATAGHGARRAGALDSQSMQLRATMDGTSKNASEIVSSLPDEYFAYPAGHPIGQMERGMVLYAAAGKARELRDTEQAWLLAAESKEWLTLALEGGDALDDSAASRCHYYLGKIAERYNGNQAAALAHYRVAGEKDATRKQAKAAAERIEYIKK